LGKHKIAKILKKLKKSGLAAKSTRIDFNTTVCHQDQLKVFSVPLNMTGICP
jgi:hypothetical protein